MPTERINLKLTVQYPAAQPIATQPTLLSKSMTAASAVLPWSSFLAQRPDKGSFPVAIPGLPEGIEVTGTNGDVVLMSETGLGQLNGTAKLQTFGANPVTDYLSAVVWGLSADVARAHAANTGTIGPRPSARGEAE